MAQPLHPINVQYYTQHQCVTPAQCCLVPAVHAWRHTQLEMSTLHMQTWHWAKVTDTSQFIRTATGPSSPRRTRYCEGSNKNARPLLLVISILALKEIKT